MLVDDLLRRVEHHPLPVIDLKLERVLEFLQRLDNPHEKLPSVVHVAGTNGKGSTIAFLRSILEAAGYRVHVYTSPHLVRFHERIVVAGQEIDDALLIDVLQKVLEASEDFPVTYFEATTAAAFLAFSRIPADIVLLETGMGGRLDATNVIQSPYLTVITPISMDHMVYLGDTIAKIAKEKAGILKQDVPCVVGNQLPEALDVITHQVKTLKAPLSVFGRDWEYDSHGVESFTYRSNRWQLEKLKVALPGKHQQENASLAIACMERLSEQFSISEDAVREGIASASWRARLQLLAKGNLLKLLPEGMKLWLDGGHNAAAGKAITQWCEAKAKQPIFIIGMMGDKDVKGYLSSLAPYCQQLIAIPIAGEKGAMLPEAIASAAVDLGIEAHIEPSVEAALTSCQNYAKAPQDVMIAGSLYLAGQILEKMSAKNS